MLHHKAAFPWAVISPTVHAMAGHAWELFEITGGFPIAIYSEQAVEAWNKFIRAFKSGAGCRARQTSIKANTYDIFKRAFLMSDPRIATTKRVLSCSRCNCLGHTARSCRHNASKVESEEESLISQCFK